MQAWISLSLFLSLSFFLFFLYSDVFLSVFFRILNSSKIKTTFKSLNRLFPFPYLDILLSTSSTSSSLSAPGSPWNSFQGLRPCPPAAYCLPSPPYCSPRMPGWGYGCWGGQSSSQAASYAPSVYGPTIRTLYSLEAQILLILILTYLFQEVSMDHIREFTRIVQKTLL